MQTFLPYANFTKVALVLDNKRLGKQRVEALDIMFLCFRHQGVDMSKELNKSEKQAEYLWKRYRKHPTVKMWIGYISALARYGRTMCEEWTDRNFADNLKPYFDNCITSLENPPWLGDKKLHRSHQSNLLRKDFGYYKQFKWNVSNNLPYVWPVK